MQRHNARRKRWCHYKYKHFPQTYHTITKTNSIRLKWQYITLTSNEIWTSMAIAISEDVSHSSRTHSFQNTSRCEVVDRRGEAFLWTLLVTTVNMTMLTCSQSQWWHAKWKYQPHGDTRRDVEGPPNMNICMKLMWYLSVHQNGGMHGQTLIFAIPWPSLYKMAIHKIDQIMMSPIHLTSCNFPTQL